MNSLEASNMTDALQSLPGKSKVRKTNPSLASSRSFLVKKPPQAPLNQPQGYESVSVRLKSGSSIREDEFLEESEQTGQADKITLENTYRVGPDPLKKFSTGKLFIKFS